mgnify:CR=1 FL=1
MEQVGENASLPPSLAALLARDDFAGTIFESGRCAHSVFESGRCFPARLLHEKDKYCLPQQSCTCESGQPSLAPALAAAGSLYGTQARDAGHDVGAYDWRERARRPGGKLRALEGPERRATARSEASNDLTSKSELI